MPGPDFETLANAGYLPSYDEDIEVSASAPEIPATTDVDKHVKYALAHAAELPLPVSSAAVKLSKELEGASDAS